MLDLSKLSASITVYGTPLYKEITTIGSVAPGEYTVEGNQIRVAIIEGDIEVGHIYATIRTFVIEEGYDPTTKVFTIVESEATRDASGTNDRGDWTVKAGARKLFAH